MIKVFHSKIFSLAGIVALFFISLSLGKEVYRKYQIQKEINLMEQEVKNLENNNADLNKLIEYFKSDAFLENEARKKLNLQKPDEKVVIFTDTAENHSPAQNNTPNTALQSAQNSQEIEEKEMENYQKWWDYFFKNKNTPNLQ